ncbi:hypothetical protein FA13DRAFT_1400422 [Coprinellus micaceus]|uniref:F-box domain-containing protein n=1 Tax=Coprinellus micaceus TaxID=71717 RepID=A0A4Y7SQ13_COPMI|nr:hypothetical protein FA13DRAFT_1400422 [Coprinellus micaceus]
MYDGYDTSCPLLEMLREYFDLENFSRLGTETAEDVLELWDIDSWRWLSRLPALETLEFQATELGRFFEVLQGAVDPQVDTQSMPFPRLSTVILSPVRFARLEPSFDFESFSTLLSILERRGRSSSLISELWIGDWKHLEKSHVTTLRARCPRVNIVWEKET